MASHHAIDTLIKRIEDDLIGGAADMARETAEALASAIGDSHATDGEELRKECLAYFDRIIAATPSVMPVTHVLHVVGAALERPDGHDVEAVRRRLVEAACEAAQRISGAVTRIASIGADLLTDGEVLFTYSISSTVFAIVRVARHAGKRVSVVTTESRPGNEGLRTLDVMRDLGVPVTVGIDAALGMLLSSCTSAIVGGDTVTSRGDALCKIGSFPAALAAKRHGIPFRVAVDTSKLDPNTIEGIPLRIREMPAADILTGPVPPHVTVRNPVFEVVPADLIECFVTEIGVVHPAAAFALMERLPRSAEVAARVAAAYRRAHAPADTRAREESGP
jgi:ribose 1,5-bisphosphate isomerase